MRNFLLSDLTAKRRGLSVCGFLSEMARFSAFQKSLLTA